jgi:hypothetical protein
MQLLFLYMGLSSRFGCIWFMYLWMILEVMHCTVYVIYNENVIYIPCIEDYAFSVKQLFQVCVFY